VHLYWDEVPKHVMELAALIYSTLYVSWYVQVAVSK